VVVGVAAAALVIAAPVAGAIAVAAVGAFALGFVIGVGVAEFQSIGHFCKPCFWKGVKKAAPTAFGIGLGVGLISALCPPLGAALVVGGAIYGTYALMDDLFGWSGGKPISQMTDDEKSQHLGGLVGGTVAGLAGGLIGGWAGGALVEAFPGLKALNPWGNAPKTGVPEENTTPSRKGVTKDPRTGKENTTVENDDAIVPDDKVDKFMRAKTQGADEDLNKQIKDLNKQKQQDQKAWNKDPQNEKNLTKLKDLQYNKQKSEGMSDTLEKAGIPDTPEENARIKQHLLEQGKNATPENRQVTSEIAGSKGKVKLVSTWTQLPDGRWRLATVRAIPIDGTPPAATPAKPTSPPLVVTPGTSDSNNGDDDE
jgi:hypothetical protein